MNRLDQIKARCGAATPGPWEYDGISFIFQNDDFMIAEIRGWGHLLSVLNLSEEEAIKQQDNNAEFIAKSREDIPYLLSEVRRLIDENISVRNWNACEKGLMDSYRDDSRRLIEVTAEFERVTAELSALKESNRWIPVEERLPEIESTEVWGMYLCKLNRYGEIKIAALWFLGGSWYSDYSIGSRYDDFVIAWRPLPEAPASEE